MSNETIGDMKVLMEESLIDKLDDDCLAAIFTYLSIFQKLKIELVCTRWRDLSQQSWRKVKKLQVHQDNRRDHLNITKILARCGSFVNELEISLSDGPNILPIIRACCLNLSTFNLSFNTDYYWSQSNRCFSNMDQLVNLNFEICRSGARAELCYDTWKNWVEEIGQKTTLVSLKLCIEGVSLSPLLNLRNLEYLNVTELKNVDDNFLNNLTDKLKNLRHLEITGCQNVTDNGISNLTRLTFLKHLEMSWIKGITRLPPGKFPKLEVMVCNVWWKLCSDSISDLVRNAPNLKILDLSLVRLTTDAILSMKSVTENRSNKGVLTVIVDSSIKTIYNNFYTDSRYLVVDENITTQLEQEES